MYKPAGILACIFILLLISTSGCSVLSSTPKSAMRPGASGDSSLVETPALPEEYRARPVVTPDTGSTPAVIQAIQNISPILPAAYTTINGTGLSGNSTNSISGNVSGGAAISGILPVAKFTSNVSGGLLPLAVQFTASDNTPPYIWNWKYDGGDLISGTATSLILVFKKAGKYQVYHTVSNSNGQAVNSTLITVCPLVPSFTANPVKGPVPLTVLFTDTSDNQPVSWNWEFGDGTANTTVQNPTHLFTRSGVYTVRMEAKNNLGSCSNSTEISVSPLIPSFSKNQSSGLVPLSIQFNDTSTNMPKSWVWDFGDTSTSRLQNPVHTFTRPGIYIVKYAATNGYDGWMTAPQDLITAFSLPDVSFTANQFSGTPGVTIIFTDRSTGFPDPTSWYWEFGDGFSTTQQNPSHQYVRAGMYDVSHSATNAQGTIWLNMTSYISIA